MDNYMHLCFANCVLRVLHSCFVHFCVLDFTYVCCSPSLFLPLSIRLFVASLFFGDGCGCLSCCACLLCPVCLSCRSALSGVMLLSKTIVSGVYRVWCLVTFSVIESLNLTLGTDDMCVLVMEDWVQ